MNANPEPKLAPPGAGLPKIELLIARLSFAWMRFRGRREEFTAKFESERDAILSLVRSRDPSTAAQRVLINRLRGLEDSSRYWSVWMTLDHLRIVNHVTAGVIRSLIQGKPPTRVASTAAVKPKIDANSEVVAEFERSCAEFLESIDETASLRTAARYTHPWFGPLDAAGWHALGGVHLGLHRRQIECILAGL